MDPLSEPSVKPEAVGRGLPASLLFLPVFFFLLMSLPLSVLVYFLNKVSFTSPRVLFMKDEIDTVGSIV